MEPKVKYTIAAKRAAKQLDQRLIDAMHDLSGSHTMSRAHEVVAAFQADAGIAVDGWPGDETLAHLWLRIRPGPVETQRRIEHAATVAVKYKLGRGGYEWLADELGELADCSGFVCWALGLSRKPSPVGDGVWWSTDSIRADAVGDQAVFRQVEPGSQPAFVVYGDYRLGGAVRQGHIGFVVDPETWEGYDCSSSQSRRRGQAVTCRDLSFFGRRDSTVWCVPVWWDACE